MSAANEFLKQSRMSKYPLAKFEKVGDSVTGRIESEPRVIQHEQWGEALLIDLVNPAYTDGGVTLWVKKGQLAAAIDEASPDGIAEGGTLTVVFVAEKDTGKPSKLKEYEASYEAPRRSVDVGSIFGDRAS